MHTSLTCVIQYSGGRYSEIGQSKTCEVRIVALYGNIVHISLTCDGQYTRIARYSQVGQSKTCEVKLVALWGNIVHGVHGVQCSPIIANL